MAGYSDEPDKLLPSPGPVTLPRQPAAGLAIGPGGHHAIVPIPALPLGKCHPRNRYGEAWQEPGYPACAHRGGRGCSVLCPGMAAANPGFCALPRHGAENLQFSLGPTTETLQKSAACRSPCSPRCPRSHRRPPPPLPGITAGRELHLKPISPSPTFPPARLIPRRDAAVKPL